MSVSVFLVCCFNGLLNSVRKPRMGERLERISYKKGLENALTQCRMVTERFEGSEETLRLIRRVEESLKMLLVNAA